MPDILNPHQLTGIEFLIQRKLAYLLDEPGLGKTAQAVVAAAALCPRRILVASPAAVREHWAREFAKWARSIPVHIETGRAGSVLQDGCTIISHANFASLETVEVIRKGGPYDVIILDEAQEFRVFTAKRTRRFFSPIDAPGEPRGIFTQASHLWLLSGTPVVNSAGDLYPFVWGPMGMNITWWDFCSKFAELVPDASTGMKAVGLRRAPELAALLRPHTLRRTAESIGLRLPPLEVRYINLPVPPDALARAMAGIEGWNERRLIQALETQDELRDPAISRVRHALGLAKAPIVANYLREMHGAGCGPVVTFFQHTSVRDELVARLGTLMPGQRIGLIDGKTTRTRIGKAEEALACGEIDDMLVQTQAGGMGLTLTRGCWATVAEMPWTSTALMQAIKRIHRIGQTRKCTADVLRSENCWLESVLSIVVSRKEKASDELLSLLTTNT